MYVVGTAGHVDHGKSTLVAALTGIHPDRLKEEQAREMTIDLGFAWFNLPSGEPVGIVDVPGHRDFIENMLAGVGGIDAALLVIAADEGVMPQTREHLAILDLLEVPKVIVTLTKCDLIETPEWLNLIEVDIKNVLLGTRFEDALILRVSARSGFGLTDLIALLDKQLQSSPPRIDYSRPRLPIDRVFTIQGFGTIVTGTLLDGSLNLGDEIEILPSHRKGKIRGLQTHKTKEEKANPGQRTAVNLSGLDLDEISRGDVLVIPSTYNLSRLITAEIRLLKDASTAITHHSEYKLFLGAKETLGFVRLLDHEKLQPGETGYIQLDLRDLITAYPGDKFVLRRPSPPETIGGGTILEAPSDRRYKRFDPDTLKSLAIMKEGDPKDRTLSFIASHFPISIAELNKSAGRPLEMDILDKLEGENKILILDGGVGKENRYLIERRWFETLTSKAVRLLESYHNRYPLKSGMPREELTSKLSLSPKVFGAFLSHWTTIAVMVENENTLRLPGFTVAFSKSQQMMVDSLIAELTRNPYTPPSVKDLTVRMGDSLYQALLDGNVLKQVSADVVFENKTVLLMTEKTIDFIQKNGTITLAQCRDLFNTSRKYAQALLEYLDGTGVTIREGDFRRLKKAS